MSSAAGSPQAVQQRAALRQEAVAAPGVVRTWVAARTWLARRTADGGGGGGCVDAPLPGTNVGLNEGAGGGSDGADNDGADNDAGGGADTGDDAGGGAAGAGGGGVVGRAGTGSADFIGVGIPWKTLVNSPGGGFGAAVVAEPGGWIGGCGGLAADSGGGGGTVGAGVSGCVDFCPMPPNTCVNDPAAGFATSGDGHCRWSHRRRGWCDRWSSRRRRRGSWASGSSPAWRSAASSAAAPG